MSLIKIINIPNEQRKRTTLASTLSYDKLELNDDCVIGFLNGNETMRWYFENYIGIDFVKANMNSQFAQIIFMTGINSNNRAIGPDLFAAQNAIAAKDTNRILLCSGMFSFSKTNEYAVAIAEDIKKVYHDNKMASKKNLTSSTNSSIDEIRKLKELYDDGIITEEEFKHKKKQLLEM